jgi:excisionase family DNA binding protein
MPPIFVDAHDLADRLEVRYDTVLGWVRQGKIPHIRDGRNRLMFNLNSVIETLCEKPSGSRRNKARKGAEVCP